MDPLFFKYCLPVVACLEDIGNRAGRCSGHSWCEPAHTLTGENGLGGEGRPSASSPESSVVTVLENKGGTRS